MMVPLSRRFARGDPRGEVIRSLAGSGSFWSFRRRELFQRGRLDHVVDQNRLWHVARLTKQADLEERDVLVLQRGGFRERNHLLPVEPDLNEALFGVTRPQNVQS